MATTLETPYLQWIKDSNNEAAVGTIMEAQVVKILVNQNFGLAMSATAEMTPNGAVAQNNIYRLPVMLKVDKYNAETPNIQKGAFDIKQVMVDREKSVIYELESFDVDAMQTIPAGTVLGIIASSVASSIGAYLDAEFITFAMEAGAKNDPIYVNFGADDDDTYDIRKEGIKQIRTLSKVGAKMSKHLSNKILGIDLNKVRVVADPEVMVDLQFSLQGYTGDNRLTKSDKDQITINNMTYGSHILIGNAVEKGKIFSDDKAFDMTKSGSNQLAGLMFHSQAIAMPFLQKMYSQFVINPNNGNPRYIFKFKYGIDTIRDELIRLILLGKAPTTPPEGGDKAKMVNKLVEAIKPDKGEEVILSKGTMKKEAGGK